MSDELRSHVLRVQVAYPRLYLACHRRHNRVGQHGDGLSDRAVALLVHLDERVPASSGPLAEHLGVVASTLSELLDGLEAQGLVTREPDPEDRRRRRILRTPEGTARMQDGSVLDTDLLSRLMATLAPDEREAAVAGLEVLGAAARRMETETEERS